MYGAMAPLLWYIITILSNYVPYCFWLLVLAVVCATMCSSFFLCPYMAVNIISVQYNGVLLPDIILSTQCYYLPSGNPFKCHGDVLSLQPMIPPTDPTKRFEIFLPVVSDAQKA